jgi:hypothetical protein
MAEITISGKLPGGDGNGLVAIAQALIDQALGNVPPKIHLAVCLVDCRKVNVDGDTHEVTPVARIRRIEVIGNPEDVEVLRNLMSRALDARTGREALPYNLEKELRGVLGEAAEAVRSEQAADDPCGGPPTQPELPESEDPAHQEVDTSSWPDDLSGLDGKPGESAEGEQDGQGSE